MTPSFTYHASPVRVLFGHGTISRLCEEAERLAARRVLVLSTPQQEDLAQRVARVLGNLSVGIFTEAAMHTPVEITERAADLARKVDADATVAVGGGSTTGLGKAIARRLCQPQIVVPTTYAGSEMTSILGETEGGRKVTVRDSALFPASVIYDVELTYGLPAGLSAASGINAIAHAVESLYARDGNPIVSALAELSISRLSAALPRIVQNPTDTVARESALMGAWLAGICLGSCEMSVHHKVCHVLGGMFELPHAETHAIVLPHSVAFLASAVPHACDAIERALHTVDAANGLYDLARSLGLPRSLNDLGMPLDLIPKAAEAAGSDLYWSPQGVDVRSMEQLLTRAFHGERPS